MASAGVPSHAALLNNGSFEDCAPNASCIAPLGNDWNYLPASCAFDVNGYQIPVGYAAKDFPDKNHATDGQYYFGMMSNGCAACSLAYNPVLKYGGIITYDLNLLTNFGGIGPQFTLRDSNQGALIYMESKPGVGLKKDQNIFLPNFDGNVSFGVVGNGAFPSGCTQNVAAIDNVRYMPYPVIDWNRFLAMAAFVSGGAPAKKARVRYSGSTPTLKDESNGRSYSMTSLGGDLFESNALSVSPSAPGDYNIFNYSFEQGFRGHACSALFDESCRNQRLGFSISSDWASDGSKSLKRNFEGASLDRLIVFYRLCYPYWNSNCTGPFYASQNAVDFNVAILDVKDDGTYTSCFVPSQQNPSVYQRGAAGFLWFEALANSATSSPMDVFIPKGLFYEDDTRVCLDFKVSGLTYYALQNGFGNSSFESGNGSVADDWNLVSNDSGASSSSGRTNAWASDGSHSFELAFSGNDANADHVAVTTPDFNYENVGLKDKIEFDANVVHPNGTDCGQGACTLLVGFSNLSSPTQGFSYLRQFDLNAVIGSVHFSVTNAGPNAASPSKPKLTFSLTRGDDNFSSLPVVYLDNGDLNKFNEPDTNLYVDNLRATKLHDFDESGSKVFSVSADGITNLEAAWVKKFSKDRLIKEGSFEEYCHQTECAWDTNTTYWSYPNGSGTCVNPTSSPVELDSPGNGIVRRTMPLTGLFSTEGQYYFSMAHSCGLSNKQGLRNGTIFFDLMATSLSIYSYTLDMYALKADGTKALLTQITGRAPLLQDQNFLVPKDANIIGFELLSPSNTQSLILDDFRFRPAGALSLVLSASPSAPLASQDFNVFAQVFDDFNRLVSDANVTLSFASDAPVPMVFAPDQNKFYATVNKSLVQAYNYSVTASAPYINDGTASSSVALTGQLGLALSESSDPVEVDDDFNVFAVVSDQNNSLVSDANLQLAFAGDANRSMAYDSAHGRYYAQLNRSALGDYNYAVAAAKTGYLGATGTGAISVKKHRLTIETWTNAPSVTVGRDFYVFARTYDRNGNNIQVPFIQLAINSDANVGMFADFSKENQFYYRIVKKDTPAQINYSVSIADNKLEGLNRGSLNVAKPSSSCNNNKLDYDEQGIDCGGVCATSCLAKYGSCIPLAKNADSSLIDVVFVGSGFDDLNELSQAAQYVMDSEGKYYGLMSLVPFKSNQSRFNFYFVHNLDTVSLPATANSDDPNTYYQVLRLYLDKRVNTCSDVDQAILLSKSPSFHSFAMVDPERQASGRVAFVSLGSEFFQFPSPQNYRKYETIRLFPHEFGHSFGILNDEYQASTQTGPATSGKTPNCAASTQECSAKWGSISSGCLAGCYYTNWFRPYENTIMRDHWALANDYNAVNEAQLTNRLQADINKNLVYPGTAGLSTANVYLAHVIYDQNTLKILDMNLIEGSSPNLPPVQDADYNITLSGIDGNRLFAYGFNLANHIVLDDGLGIDLNSLEFYLRIPFFIKATEITVTDVNNNTPLAKVNVLATSRVTAREIKLAERSDLNALRSSFKGTNLKSLDGAVKQLTTSLTDSYWVDGNTLSVKFGRRVFVAEGKAVNANLKLMKVKNLDANVVTDLNRVDFLLVKADELLARTALDAARSTPVLDSSKQKKYAAALAKADAAFSKAFIQVAANKPGVAIQQFGNAWLQSQNTLKFALSAPKKSVDEAKDLEVDVVEPELEEDK